MVMSCLTYQAFGLQFSNLIRTCPPYLDYLAKAYAKKISYLIILHLKGQVLCSTGKIIEVSLSKCLCDYRLPWNFSQNAIPFGNRWIFIETSLHVQISGYYYTRWFCFKGATPLWWLFLRFFCFCEELWCLGFITALCRCHGRP